MNNFETLVEILIRDEMEGREAHERLLLLGDTPEYLVEKAGFPLLPLAMKGKVLSKACFEHGIGTSMLKRLPAILASPKSVFRSANPQLTDSVVVLTLEVKSMGPIIVPIRQNQQIGRDQYYNLVSSVYAKEGEDPGVKWKRNGLLIHEW